MADFISGVIAGAVLLWVVQWIVAVMLERHIDRQVAEIERMMAAQQQAQSVYGRVEEINGCFYVYDQATDEFLAQGSTLLELDHVLKQRWPDRTVFVKEGVDDAIQRLKATQ